MASFSTLWRRGSVGMSTRRVRADRPRLNKALGQHLLVSDGVLDEIIKAGGALGGRMSLLRLGRVPGCSRADC